MNKRDQILLAFYEVYDMNLTDTIKKDIMNCERA